MFFPFLHNNRNENDNKKKQPFLPVMRAPFGSDRDVGKNEHCEEEEDTAGKKMDR
jgi:hypothetical protein